MPCPMCTDPDGELCVPYYGVGPHICFYKIPGATVGQSQPLPKDQWPEAYQEDPDCPGMGTYWCPHCGEGKPDGAAAPKISHPREVHMAEKHTPGPWMAKQLAVTGRWAVLWRAKGGTHMKRVDSVGEFTESDARLVAASPDLLEAAQAAWNCIAELPPTQARVEVALLLQAAIEKADPPPAENGGK